MTRPRDRGQATVEAALLLPVVAVALLAVIQVGLLVHARVMVTHAAREGVRVAATGGDHSDVSEAVVASGRLPPQRLDVDISSGSGRVTVTVHFAAPTNVPIVGALVGDLALDAQATMRIER
ncbi:MAG: TadE family protein [Actinomycetota bacterium]